jgi:gliding motility-associated-like protein
LTGELELSLSIMNFKRLPAYFVFLFLSLFLFRNETIIAQNSASIETSEKIYEYWFYALDDIKQNTVTDKKEYETFSRFSFKSIDSLRGDFLKKIGTGEVTLANAGNYEVILAKELSGLYAKYRTIKKEYPSSVEEYMGKERPAYIPASCDSACNNIDFSLGNLSGWNAYYGYNASGTTGTNITSITGGLAGAVTEAANDPLTSTPGDYNATVGPNPSPDYQVSITSGTRGDAIVPTVPVVSPFGGQYSVMLGDSTEVNYGVAVLSQTFLVAQSNANFTYQYAVFLANPSHNYYQQPFFKIFFLDQNNDTIPFCGEYTVVSGHGTQTFDSISYNSSTINETFPVYYKNWTLVNVPLKHYIGQCVTVVFEAGDCSLGGHFGYAYIDASCSPLTVLSTSQFFCGQDTITLSGPSGESGYQWSGPSNGIVSSSTTQNITIDSSGTYTLVITPVTGAPCNDTLTITIGKKPGPPPHPNFTADTVCVGGTTSFTNISNPVTGGNFYWDFYNVGTYQDSTVNPTWTYNLPGTYTVKLEEMVNGCGSDTLITVVVDSNVAASFNSTTVCMKDSAAFTNMSTNATSFIWNFGDPSSGSKNSSTSTNPYHTYNSSGTYTVTLVAANAGCADSITESVTVLPAGSESVIGPETICQGTSAEITASGGNSYRWSTGATSPTISVSPGTNTTYYCVITNNNGCTDTAFNEVIVKPAPTISACCDTSLIPGQTAQLTANGSSTYSWSPSYGLSCTTCSDPVAAPTASITYTVTTTNDSGCSATQYITIDVSCGEIFVPDVFTPGNPEHNNVLFVRGPCITTMVFEVFDRWGNRVFESESQDIGWDGRHNGMAVNEGTYVWLLKATLFDGTYIEKKGNVTLVR